MGLRARQLKAAVSDTLRRAVGIALLTVGPLMAQSIAAQSDTEATRIGYLGQQAAANIALANIESEADDEGRAGAELGIADNNTTGRFTGQRFELTAEILAPGDDPAIAIDRLRADGIDLFVLDLTDDRLQSVLERVGDGRVLLFNARSGSRRFREAGCHRRLLHTALSRDMRTDALAQYLAKKRWREWLLVTGPRPEDALYAAALRRSARKFGLEILEERRWTGEHDARRTARAEVPLFTQGIDYDVLLVADEIGDFGDYLSYQTWLPRPVAGTQSLYASAWDRPLEQWGAAQLQERFLDHGGRVMRERDYAAWLAVRSIGEAVTRTGSTNSATIADYIQSDAFELAAFKGRKLSFRGWNGQMRQPVPLMTPRSVVAQAPIEGFLHPVTDLDTLGIDMPESSCSSKGSQS